MADTTPVETVIPGDSQTTVTTPAPTGNAGTAEVERLRKEKEQGDLRIRQLENQAAARQKADDDAKAKTLEENEQYKDLWAAATAEKEALIRERDDATRRATLTTATDKLLGNYSPAVRELAVTAGLSLSDDSDTSIAELTTKLDTFASKLGSPRVTANNPAPSAAPTDNREAQISVMRMNNIPNSAKADARRSAISNLAAVKEMKAANGFNPEQ